MSAPHPSFLRKELPVISGRSGRSFTLIELMVAMAISLLLAALVLSFSTKLIGDLARQNERLQTQAVARFVLNRISQDLGALVPLPPPAEWLNLTGASTNFANISGNDLMFFTTARDRPAKEALDGSLSAVSYRLIVQPLQSGGDDFFGLYRAVMGAEESFIHGSASEDLATLWTNGGPFSSNGSSRSSLLAQNVVGFRVFLNFQNEDGTLESQEAPLQLGPVWSGSAAVGLPDNIRRLVSAEVSLTILSQRGEQARAEGTLSNEEVLKKYGDTYSRIISINSTPARK